MSTAADQVDDEVNLPVLRVRSLGSEDTIHLVNHVRLGPDR